VRPRDEWNAIAGEFTTAGPIYVRFLLPMAAIGPVASTLGAILFQARGSLITFGTIPMSLTAAIQAGVLEYGLNLLGAYGLAVAIDLLAPSVGGQSNRVQALKVAAYGTTPYWLASAAALFPMIEPIVMLVALYSVRLFAVGLPSVMKVPREKATAYTLLTSIAAVLIGLVITAVLTGMSGR
jgi:Yip1-like protein